MSKQNKVKINQAFTAFQKSLLKILSKQDAMGSDEEEKKERQEFVQQIKRQLTIGGLFKVLRSQAWDVWTAMSFFADCVSNVDRDIENGSCQDLCVRQAAQIAVLYEVPLDCFYNWDT